MADKKKPSAKSEADKAKAKAKLEAYYAKRKAKMTELKTKDPIKFKLMVNIKEAKEFDLIDKEPTAGKDSPWEQFCEMKKAASIEYWNAAKSSRVTNQKVIEKKKAKKAKLQEILAKLNKELGEDTPAE